MKKLIFFILVCLLTLSITCPAFAEQELPLDQDNIQQEQPVAPMGIYIDDVKADATVNADGTVVTCKGFVRATDAYSLKVVVYLQIFQRGYYETVKSWSATGIWSVELSEDHAITDSIYRVFVEGYVYDSNGNRLELSYDSCSI